MSGLESLRERLAELADLSSLGRLAAWDQRTMMPPAGAASRAQQLGALQRLAHERATGDDIGAWLEEIASDGDLGDVDRDVVRVARRDWDRERRIPADLAAARVKAAAEGQAVWQDARARSDFALFAPALERNLVLAREYAACLDDGGHPYDALLADYTEQSSIVLQSGTITGLPAIRRFFEDFLKDIRPGFWEAFKIQRQEVCADVAYLVWEAKPFVAMATDTLLVRDGKIHVQTFTTLG